MGKNGWMGQFGIKGIFLELIGGQFDFEWGQFEDIDFWGFIYDVCCVEVWVKVGKVFFNCFYVSMGLQFFGNIYYQEFIFGNWFYDGDQESFYVNWIYKIIIIDICY